jgi:hypothetical protein
VYKARAGAYREIATLVRKRYGAALDAAFGAVAYNQRQSSGAAIPIPISTARTVPTAAPLPGSGTSVESGATVASNSNTNNGVTTTSTTGGGGSGIGGTNAKSSVRAPILELAGSVKSARTANAYEVGLHHLDLDATRLSNRDPSRVHAPSAAYGHSSKKCRGGLVNCLDPMVGETLHAYVFNSPSEIKATKEAQSSQSQSATARRASRVKYGVDLRD